MITKKVILNKVLKEEKNNYFFSNKDFIKSIITNNERNQIWKFQKALRKAEFYFNTKNKNLLKMINYFIQIRRKNKYGSRLGIHMMINVIDEGLCIYHSGSIVISGYSRIGKNLKLHGNNCVGNNGKDNKVPVIGDNCDLGFGSIVI